MAEVDRLTDLTADVLIGGQGLGVLETAVRVGMTALGASLLAGLLAADPGHAGPRVDCGGGHQAAFVGYRAKTLDTVLGPVDLRRAWYHCRHCHAGRAPLDERLGVAGASLSPGLAAMIDHAAAQLPFATARSLLAELAGITLTVKRIERAAEADGAAAATALAERAAALCGRRAIPLPPPQPAPDKLYLAVDGTGIPMTPAETAGRPGKGADGRAQTREVKLAAVFTQTRLDADGHPIRDPASTSYVATLDGVERFTELAHAEAIRRGSDHIRQLVVLGDGAKWIWNLATTRLPEATQIVDLFHAREHLHELADHLDFMLTDRDAWLADRLTELDAGNIDAIVAAARAYPLVGVHADQREKDLAYFTTNAHRMQYARFRELGMFVGSGVVEAGCKAVIGQRLKLSGMRWAGHGATAITTLRCQHATSPDRQAA